jgi:hypothetical protein
MGSREAARFIISLKQNPRCKQQTASNKQNERCIDPDTELICYNTGFASICESPQGTVHYLNKHGLDCARTSFTNVCTNF